MLPKSLLRDSFIPHSKDFEQALRELKIKVNRTRETHGYFDDCSECAIKYRIFTYSLLAAST